MSFLVKPNSPEQIKLEIERARQAKLLKDFDVYGSTYFFQRQHINAMHDLIEAMHNAARIDDHEFILRKAAVDKVASKCFAEFTSTLEDIRLLHQLRIMTTIVNEQIEKELSNDVQP